MLESRIRILQGMSIFKEIDHDTISKIVDDASIVEILDGDYFFREGEHAHSMFVLERGTVAIYRDWQGNNYKIRDLKEGDCFGEIALLDNSPRSASVQALEFCEAIRISAEQMESIRREFPEQYTQILLNLGRELCQRLRDADTGLFIHEMQRRDRR